jgi:hypothetical protein
MENNFDKSYRKKLESHNSSMDLDQFWNDLEPKLPKQKKKRYFFWWFISGLILIGISIAKIKYFHSEKNRQNVGMESPINISNSNDSIKQNTKPDSHVAKTPMNQNLDSKARKSKPDENNNNNSTHRENIQHQSKILKIAKPRAFQPRIKQNKSSQIASNSSRHSNTISYYDLIQSNIDLTSNSELPKPSDAIIVESAKFNNQEVQRIHKEQNESINKDPQFSEQRNDKQIHSNKSEIQEQSNSNKNIGITDKNANTDSAPSIVVLQDSTEKNIPINDLASELDQTKKFHFYFKPLICVGAYAKKYSKGDSSSINYLAVRKATESNLEEWSVNMVSGIQWHRWSVESGVQYLQRNEKFEIHENKGSYTFGLTSLKREYSNGSTDSIQVQAWNGEGFNRHVIHYNKLRQYNIPITLSYDCYKSNLWTFGVNAGLLMSVSSNYQGRLLTKNLQITEIDQKILTNNLGFTGQTGIFIQYRYSDQVELFSWIQYYHFLTSLHIEHLQLRYNSLQLGLGVHLKLY